MNKDFSFKLGEDGYLSQDDTKKYYSRFGFACFAFGLISLLVSIIAALILNNFFPYVTENNNVSMLVSHIINNIAIYGISLPILIMLLKPLPSVKPIKEKMSLKHFICCICISFSLTLIGSYISNFFLSLNTLITKTSPENPVSEMLDGTNIIISLIFMGILAPILEEIVFRKIFCGKLLALGEGPAIIISAAFFGALHSNFYQFAYAFLLGLFFGFIYVKTGKLRYSIIIHMIINLFSGVFASFVNSIFPFEALEEIMKDSEIMSSPEKLSEALSPYATPLTLYMIYSYVLMGLAIAGIVILFIATRKRKFTLEKGILPPEKSHRFSNFFLTGGVAAMIALTAFQFILSLFPTT